MILIAVGSQKFPFDRLIKEIDRLVETGVIKEPVFGQIGASTYEPLHYEYKRFLGQTEFKEKLKEADLIITHGGTGVITNAVKAGKKVIGVPRRVEYGEHVDNHQEQLINEFVEQNLIWGCTDIKKLESCIKTSKENKKEPYHSNTETYIKEIDSILKKMIK